MRISINVIFVFVLCLFSSGAAEALPIYEPLAHDETVHAIDVEYLNGTVDVGHCSGAVVQFIGQRPSDRAYIMTNGHCIGSFPSTGTAVYHKKYDWDFDVRISKRESFEVQTDLLVYATMTDTDVAFFRLTSSIQEILDKGAQVRVISDQPAEVGEYVHVPSGRWRSTPSCTYEEQIFILKESTWIWRDVLALGGSNCNMTNGGSGSPIISERSQMIVGVWNTFNESGGACGFDNPCEVDEQGNVKVNYLRRYGQQVWHVYTCLNSDNEIDLSVSGCLLETNHAEE